MDSHTVKKFQDALIKKKSELQHLSSITELDRQPVQLDQSTLGRLTRINAIQSQEMQLETERRREIEFIRIDAALKKIEAGDFGICESCKLEIPLKRLALNPSATRCVECAQD